MTSVINNNKSRFFLAGFSRCRSVDVFWHLLLWPMSVDFKSLAIQRFCATVFQAVAFAPAYSH
jgi:hypothetical protein